MFFLIRSSSSSHVSPIPIPRLLFCSVLSQFSIRALFTPPRTSPYFISTHSSCATTYPRLPVPPLLYLSISLFYFNSCYCQLYLLFPVYIQFCLAHTLFTVSPKFAFISFRFVSNRVYFSSPLHLPTKRQRIRNTNILRLHLQFLLLFGSLFQFQAVCLFVLCMYYILFNRNEILIKYDHYFPFQYFWDNF